MNQYDWSTAERVLLRVLMMIDVCRTSQPLASSTILLANSVDRAAYHSCDV